ncbi:MAG: F0F1 ATP synthase subunit epsilon [Candidatus Endonucleobacter bathymodioli]|uniref:ATP synthase epsilon chain n=1 Tax=Candidatus Endonucleibacter bathymodioli TaxID=539814 RepID=A0AA90NJP1_9GAMM|nr:F0F1 ATP synthase subunit epsilon [Candidatus Endonucleobacter bathymodioli]
MTMTIYCDIVSAETEIFSGMVEMVVATGILGDLGITPSHTPLLTELKPGPIRLISQGGGEDIFYISGGFLEVQPGLVKVLADTALRASDINEASAQEAKNQAERVLFNQSGAFDYSHAAIKLAEAAAQLRTLHAIRKKMG